MSRRAEILRPVSSPTLASMVIAHPGRIADDAASPKDSAVPKRRLGFSRRFTQVRKFLGRARHGDVEALREAYPQPAQFGQHFGRLHPLGDGPNAHGFADLADRLHHAAIDSIAGDVFHELTVDL